MVKCYLVTVFNSKYGLKYGETHLRRGLGLGLGGRLGLRLLRARRRRPFSADFTMVKGYIVTFLNSKIRAEIRENVIVKGYLLTVLNTKMRENDVFAPARPRTRPRHAPPQRVISAIFNRGNGYSVTFINSK